MRDRTLGAAALLGLSAVAVYAGVTCWHEPLYHGPDTDKIFGAALTWLEQGEPPGLGNGILPTALRLGPAWAYLLGALWWLTSSMEGVFRGLVVLNALVVVGGGAALSRWYGPAAGVAFAAVCVADPLLYMELVEHPFWYQQYLGLVVVPAMVGLLGTLLEGRAAWWLLSALMVGLAAQVHAIAWTLVPVWLWVGWVRRQTLGGPMLVWGLTFLVVGCLPMVRQVPLALRPEAIVSMFQSADEAAQDRSLALDTLWLTWQHRVLGGVLGVGGSVAAMVALAWGKPTTDPVGAAGKLLAVWAVAVAAVVSVIAHRWHIHYNFLQVFMLGLAVACLARWLAARWGQRAGIAASLVLLLQMAVPQSFPLHRPDFIPWHSLTAVHGLYARLADDVGATRADVFRIPLRVHGLAPAWPPRGDLPVDIGRALLPVGASTLADHVTVRWEQGEAVVERWPDCLAWSQDGPQVQVQARCAVQGRVHLVLAAQAGVEPLGLAGWIRTAERVGETVRHEVWVDAAGEPWPEGSGHAWALPPKVVVVDVFVASQVMDAAALGLVDNQSWATARRSTWP